LSEEHVIPASLGGDLKCEFLCKSCNDRFGSGFEAKAKSDPAIRLAVARLQAEIPELHSSIEHGQEYVAYSGAGRIRGTFRKAAGEVRAKASRLDDGSLIVPMRDASGHIEKILKRDGHDSKFIQRALASLGEVK
jgi:hypothetical protein